jgi:hypothetical protein
MPVQTVSRLPAQLLFSPHAQQNRGRSCRHRRRSVAFQLTAHIICCVSVPGPQSLVDSEFLAQREQSTRKISYSQLYANTVFNIWTPEVDESLYLQSRWVSFTLYTRHEGP